MVTGDMYVSQKHRYHFADETSIIQSNPTHCSKDYQKKQVSKDLSNLSNWFRANKLSLNLKKTELVIFRPRKLKIDHSFKLKLNGKRLVPANLLDQVTQLHPFFLVLH